MAKDSNLVLVIFVVLVILISAMSTWRALRLQDESGSSTDTVQNYAGYATKNFITTGNFGLRIVQNTNTTQVGA